MTRVLVVAHHEHVRGQQVADDTLTWLAANGHDVWMQPEDAKALGLEPWTRPSSAEEPELVVSLGGDGTMLRTVNLLDGAPTPIIGVNLGWLGYLTELEPPDVLDGLERYFQGSDVGHWHLDERLMLDIALNGGSGGTWRGLNEGVVEKHESGHTVRLLVRIDGEPFTTYAADGLIVATPTGSTAYSLSARGPVVSPRHRALLVTPVSPHMLFDRSLVLDPSERVEIEVLGHRPAGLSVDGQQTTILGEGDVVTFSPSVATARFVRFGERHYHQILKAKFGLADR